MSLPRILIADDNAQNRELLEAFLARIECDTAFAVDGQDTLNKVESFKPDLILLDVMMPEMDGYTALGRMKADPAQRHIPVIMISALDEIESVVRCIETGAEDFLPKPFSLDQLAAKAKEAMRPN
jgi:CheY-like chemotaxis protein